MPSEPTIIPPTEYQARAGYAPPPPPPPPPEDSSGPQPVAQGNQPTRRVSVTVFVHCVTVESCGPCDSPETSSK